MTTKLSNDALLNALAQGNLRQQGLYRLLNTYPIFDWFSRFNPTLVSTIVVGLDLPDSDVDILCCFDCIDDFIHAAENYCAVFNGFEYRTKPCKGDGSPVCIVRFWLADTGAHESELIEIYASTTPVEEQAGFVHFAQMYRLVNLGRANFQRAIKALKASGLKTEPAIAELLNLTGDPYEAVASLSGFTDQELANLLNNGTNPLTHSC